MINLDKLESYDLKNADGELTNKKIIRTKFRLLELFNQGYNIVVYIRGSSARTDYFKKLAERIILINNRTRWNSWYNILLIFLKLKGIVEKYYKNYENKLKKDLLSHTD